MQTCVWSPHMPGLHHIQVVDRIEIVDNTNVKYKRAEMQRSELLCSLSGTHTLLFLRLHCCIQQLFNPVNVVISKFFKVRN